MPCSCGSHRVESSSQDLFRRPVEEEHQGLHRGRRVELQPDQLRQLRRRLRFLCLVVGGLCQEGEEEDQQLFHRGTPTAFDVRRMDNIFLF